MEAGVTLSGHAELGTPDRAAPSTCAQSDIHKWHPQDGPGLAGQS